jgi:hypothetical protein
MMVEKMKMVDGEAVNVFGMFLHEFHIDLNKFMMSGSLDIVDSLQDKIKGQNSWLSEWGNNTIELPIIGSGPVMEIMTKAFTVKACDIWKDLDPCDFIKKIS